MQRLGQQALRQTCRARSAAVLPQCRQLQLGFRGFAAGPQDVLDKYAALNAGKGRAAAQPSSSPQPSAGSPQSAGDVIAHLDRFQTEVISTNWADYLTLVYSVPFWEQDWQQLEALAGAYKGNAEVAAKLAQTQDLMDCFYRCEDVRDHINELCELATRSSGLMGTGYAAGEKVENIDDHAVHCAKEYEVLLKEHSDWKPKIEQTVGHGLAILRSKHKFKFQSMHRYFY
eukprot:TRINITY_DN48167_c0_g1_i1.p1 TRINITY_DN48167_c0_g1~~TRINITY_DN48167_c0_g1_i1.p1  ORF type:complete len:229 (+),score=58.96 TRINITY_DN48167_c0_g1_i1:70-756(+)